MLDQVGAGTLQVVVLRIDFDGDRIVGGVLQLRLGLFVGTHGVLVVTATGGIGPRRRDAHDVGAPRVEAELLEELRLFGPQVLETSTLLAGTEA